MKTALHRFWFIILLFIPFLALNAQTTLIIQGYVNNLSNQPIAGKIVTIQIDSVFAAPTFTYSGTVVSGANGYYVDSVLLPIGANVALVVAHVIDCNNTPQYSFQWYNAPTALPLMNFAICSNINPITCDVGVTRIVAPSTFINPNTTAPVTIMVKNFGTVAQSMIPVSYRVNFQPPIVTEVIASSIPPNDSLAYTFTTTANLGNGGTHYNFEACTGLLCDTFTTNDTAWKSVLTLNPNAIPYTANFDSSSTFTTDPINVWQWGSPNASIINSAYSGNNAWTTVLAGNYPNNSNTYLYTPVFNFSAIAYTDTVLLNFQHWLAVADANDFGQVQFSINGGSTWIYLGFFGDPSGTNWYNWVGAGVHGFNFTNSGWMYSSYKLDPTLFNGQSQVQFRFRFYSDLSGASNGWAIDDFSLSLISPGIKIGMLNINTPLNDTFPGTSIHAVVTFQNFGVTNAFTVPIDLKINGVVVASETWTGFLPAMAQTTYTFNQPFTVPAGPYHLCAASQTQALTPPLSNEFCRQYFGMSAPLGYLYGLLTANASAAGPSQVYLIQHNAVPGTLTAIDTTLSVDSSGVTTYHFANITPGNYLVKAAMLPTNPNYAANIPSYHQSSLFWNQAATVNVLPNAFTQANISFVQGINPGGPGFVGGLVAQGANKGPGDPIQGVQILLLDVMNNDQPVAVAFSDATGHFAFSNIPFGTFKVYAEMLNKTTNPVIVTVDATNPSNDAIQIVVGATVISFIEPPSDFSMGTIGLLYPNPASAISTLPVTLIQNTTLYVTISDLTGHILSKETLSKNAGQHLLDFDISNLSSGIYIVSVKAADGSGAIRKLVIQ